VDDLSVRSLCVNLTSHQRFVEKEEKRGSAFLKKRGFLIKKEEKKRHTVFVRRKLKLTGTIVVYIQQHSYVINIG
jgi:hypothetical protein